MDCRNCKANLPDQCMYCGDCGAKVIKERITLRNLLSGLFANAFGWDNKYFFTLRNLLASPEIPFKGYIDGTRKKFVNPFAFFAIAAAVGLLVFNLFVDEYVNLSRAVNEKQIEIMDGMFNDKTEVSRPSSDKNLKAVDFKKQQMEQGAKTQKIILKYFNLIAFLMLPLYALIAFFVFGKPYNYGEHLVINAYIQGVTMLFSIMLFLISLFTSPIIYLSVLFTVIAYYIYAYKRLYRLSAAKTIVLLMKFIGITLAAVLVLLLFSFMVGILIKKLGLIPNTQ